MKKIPVIRVLSYIFILFSLLFSSFTYAEEDHHEDHDHWDRYHFAHPLISESPTPDTKIRLDYFFLDVDGEDIEEGFEAEASGNFKEHTVRLVLEYAFSPNISIEAEIPYTFLDVENGSDENHFNNIEATLKFASFRFAEYGIVVGGGLGFGFPTGNDNKGIGSDNILEIGPFLSFGYKHDNFEYITFLTLGIPVNQDSDQDEGNEFLYNISFLYHLGESVDAILEFDGLEVLNGEEEGLTVFNIDPGIIISPFENKLILFGFGAGFPLTNDKEFNYRLVGSFFYHFHM